MRADKLTRQYFVAGFVILSLVSQAQTARRFEAELLPDFARSGILFSHFERFSVFQLDIEAINQHVRQPDYDGRLDLLIGDHRWPLLLTEHDIRGNHWKSRLRQNGKVLTLTNLQNITFRGHLLENAESMVRLSIKSDLLYGMIDDGETKFFIEPLSNFDQAQPQLFVVYRADDVKPDEHGSLCGVTAKEKLQERIEANHQGRSSPPACLITELAIALDFSYVDHHNGYTSAVDQAISVMNTVDPNFDEVFESDIEFEIVEMFVSTTPADDPVQWTDTLDGGVLLSNFRSWGNSGGFVGEFDLAQLWTKRNFHYENKYGVVGLAYVGTTCYYSRYHLLEHYTSNPDKLRALTAHEIGHNFGANHDTLTTYIMRSSVNPDAVTFSQMSSDAVNASLASRTCLSDCNLTCHENVTILMGDPGGNFEAGITIRTIGSVTISTSSVFDAPEVQLYPNFSTASGVSFEVRTDGCP